MISVVIPAYNEESRLPKAIERLLSTLQNPQIIVVFEGNDRTPEVVKKFNVTLLINSKRLGKGGSIKRGLEMVKYDKILITDADLPIPDELLKRIMNCDADLVIIKRRVIGLPLLRKVLSNGFKFLVKLMFPSLITIHDFQSGIKLIKRDKLENVFNELVLNDLVFDVNLIYAFKRRGYKIKELEGIYFHDESGSKISKKLIKIILLMFLSLVKLRIYYSPFKRILYTKTFLKIQDFILSKLRY